MKNYVFEFFDQIGAFEEELVVKSLNKTGFYSILNDFFIIFWWSLVKQCGTMTNGTT